MRRAVLVLILLVLSVVPGFARESWTPAHTWVFAVGCLEWKDADNYHSFPKARRRDERLVELLRKRGVPSDHVTFIEDAAATHEAIVSKFDTLLSKTQAGDLLIVYYAGHGNKTKKNVVAFVPYDARGNDNCWSVHDIFAEIEKRFKGDRVLLTADCCYSGSLSKEALQKRSGRIAYAVLTSSRASSSSTGAWTYTEALLDGFAGNALVDRNHDGQVTLGELGAYTEDEMTFGDEQLSKFEVTGSFPEQLVIAEAAPKPAGSRVGERLEVLQDGKWWRGKVVEERDGKYHIHYYGWDETFDEWVTADRMRPLVLHEKWPIGSKVMVMWQKKWYPATVKRLYRGVHYVHYDEEDGTWDEWVDSARIKARG